MKIGEFAKENNTTVRTLRHYESLGLLMPAEIDRFTGYRFYKKEQVSRLKGIQLFKDLGFSLSEITSLLEDEWDREELTGLLSRKSVQARIDRMSACERGLGLESLLAQVKKMPEGRLINLLEVSDLSIRKKRIPKGDSLMDSFRLIWEKAVGEKKNVSLMIIDIDFFARINEESGRRVGDAVIDAVRRSIEEHSPEGSGLFWGNLSVMEHKGGDEFLNWMECSPEEGMRVAEAIRADVAHIDFSYMNRERPATLSIGVVHSRDFGEDFENFIRQGDGALSDAKLGGRNRVSVALPG